MADHRITVRSTHTGTVTLRLDCSCGRLIGSLDPSDGTRRVPLDEINRLADEHIGAAEKE